MLQKATLQFDYVIDAYFIIDSKEGKLYLKGVTNMETIEWGIEIKKTIYVLTHPNCDYLYLGEQENCENTLLVHLLPV